MFTLTKQSVSESRSPSAAQNYLAVGQRRYKPRSDRLYGAGYTQALVRDLTPGMIEPLRNLIMSGDVAIGELGKNLPDIRVVPTDNFGLAIEISSAMLEFTSYL